MLSRFLCLNSNKTPGPDKIYHCLLKNCAISLCKPIHYLFDQSLYAGELPTDWKNAKVTPIHKKGARSQASNYRPISLTSQVFKVLESTIRDYIGSFLTDNKLLTDKQHGFSKANEFTWIFWGVDSCSWWPLWSRCYLLRLQKSIWFDPSSKITIGKKKSYGIEGNLFKWLFSFLHNRIKGVVLNGASSHLTQGKSRVPQGSVLGPLLFILYINDLSDNVTCGIKLFADNTKIYSTKGHRSDTLLLQQDL